MRRVVTDHKVGEILAESERDPSRLAERIRNIVENQPAYSEYVKNCITASSLLCWDSEKIKLLAIYGGA
jgi:hypothetical protein